MESNNLLIGLVVSVSFLAVGLLMILKRKKYEANGSKVSAIISDLSLQYSSGKPLYYPTVKFTTVEGVEVTKKHSSGSYPSLYTKNENITVIYLKGDNTNFIIGSKKSVIVEMVVVLIGLGGIMFCLWGLIN
ncbi:DUF3592 domain-containing protein [Pedobacter duraquae]|uniref:Uncharacterized protein DUF3592 n=1 Tax=Pedobacter duraquae TaxID=425511 RepID=A0A4R6IHU4_9SPHI|nr:DUF3592 domain-containing protein [Pedobacter duraquae]TDO21275.1 uncharacterized protein DUF3592 [Pedobacter duraquae]